MEIGRRKVGKRTSLIVSSRAIPLATRSAPCPVFAAAALWQFLNRACMQKSPQCPSRVYGCAHGVAWGLRGCCLRARDCNMSTSSPIDSSVPGIPCHRCGYDVRAQQADGRCPECDASVPESRRLALIPRRPAWRDSDPRWRRRMLAGAWVLVLVPLMAVLQGFQWAERIPVPTFYDVQRGQSLDDSYFAMVYLYFAFCIGVVLLFSEERNRQLARFDRTR